MRQLQFCTKYMKEKTMPKVTWNGVVLAESDKHEKVEGNYYFPPDSINRQYFKKSQTQTTCPWKGVASYYDIEVNGEIRQDAAWYYPAPSRAAKHIKNYVAFYRRGGVKIEKGGGASSEADGGFLTALKRLVGA